MSLLGITLGFVAIILYTFQNFFNRMFSTAYDGPRGGAAGAFSICYGLTVSVGTFIVSGFKISASPLTNVFGLANGLVLFIYNISAIEASNRGPYAFQNLCNLVINILLTLVFCMIYWKDELRVTKLVGIALMISAFIIFNLKGLKQTGAKRWYYTMVILMGLMNAAYSIIMDAQQRVCGQGDRSGIIIVTFTTSAVISLVYLLITQRGAALSGFRMSKLPLIYMLISSVSAMLAVNILVYALSIIVAPVFSTITNGGVLVCNTMLCAAVLREKVQKHMWIGIVIACIALVLLNL